MFSKTVERESAKVINRIEKKRAKVIEVDLESDLNPFFKEYVVVKSVFVVILEKSFTKKLGLSRALFVRRLRALFLKIYFAIIKAKIEKIINGKININKIKFQDTIILPNEISKYNNII